MRDGEWYHHFVGMACAKLSGMGHDIAHVPLLPMEYLWAPIEWVMADGPAGECSFISFIKLYAVLICSKLLLPFIPVLPD